MPDKSFSPFPDRRCARNLVPGLGQSLGLAFFISKTKGLDEKISDDLSRNIG